MTILARNLSKIFKFSLIFCKFNVLIVFVKEIDYDENFFFFFAHIAHSYFDVTFFYYLNNSLTLENNIDIPLNNDLLLSLIELKNEQLY